MARELAPAGLRSRPLLFGAASLPSGSKLPRHRKAPEHGPSLTSAATGLFVFADLQRPVPTAAQRGDQLHTGNQSALQEIQHTAFIA
ncbi:hypothetical protein EAH78_29105 [Pseudomonas arsenicoxydans]|uniref:Uncharacterized protein n=1 Tax=Pseudomonas arsenicoxydans TaxID=702115 RepID=A0A502H1Y9_9PSED|nr:hypothetical protein EAH78_29105 [Pseudomonas arsenicoxydans]